MVDELVLWGCGVHTGHYCKTSGDVGTLRHSCIISIRVLDHSYYCIVREEVEK